MFEHILLATHGTNGAQNAEHLVFETLQPRMSPTGQVTVLTVINEEWKWMLGDDWLNTSKSRRDFLNHVESQLVHEIDADWQRVKTAFPGSVHCDFIRKVGPVGETIVETAVQSGCDLIVIGPYQKKQGRGFKDRLKNKEFHPQFTLPLMVAPQGL